MITGTIRSAVKLQVLDSKWQQKKNDINAKKPVKEMSKEERMLAEFQEQAQKERENNAHADLYNKLKTGGKLTAEEISYLEQKDPESLRKYREDQAEKEAYERELKNCRTKDEVERVKMNKLGNFATQAKKITTDPYIPLDKKLELMNQLNDKLCRVQEAHMEFLNSEKYKDMPSEADEAKDRAEERNIQSEETLEILEEAAEAEESVDAEVEAEISEDVEYKVDSDVDFEELSDSILRFTHSVDKHDSRIDISV